MEFRFYYFTSRYEETVAFYRDSLGFTIYHQWDRANDRGTIFRSPNGGGFIEIESGSSIPTLTGGFYIEVDNLDFWHERVRSVAAPSAVPIRQTSYGHRSFKTTDPSGVEVCFFSYVERPPHALC